MINDQLIDAIYRGEAQLLRDGLASSAGVVDVDEDGRTVLMCALLADIPAPLKSEILEILLERGAPVNHKDTGQAWTALAFAARDCSAAICSLLIAAGAEIDATDTFGNTPLWRATMAGREENVRLLLAHGANPDHANKNGVSARIVAARLGKHYFEHAGS